MAAETQYTANTGIVQISTANANLDGTGTLGTVLTGASNGTLIETVIIKGITDNAEGTVRLFLYDGTNTRILNEIHIPANTKSGTNPAFQYTWNCNISLKSGWALKASTQNAETFNIIAQGLNWAYYSGAVRPESTNFTANTGMGTISVANSNLDGTGTTTTVLTAGASGSGWKGCRIQSLNLKAVGSIVISTVRFYINDGSNTRLFKEVQVPGMPQIGTQSTYQQKIDLGNFALQAGYSIIASTETGQTFSVIVEGNDWKYPA